jgi:hypothetical protein
MAAFMVLPALALGQLIAVLVVLWACSRGRLSSASLRTT